VACLPIAANRHLAYYIRSHHDPTSNSNNTMVLPLRFIIAYILFVPLYVTNYRWIPASVSLRAQTPGSLDRTLDIRTFMSRTNMRQWHLTVAKMVNVLNVIIVGSTLALSYAPLITTSFCSYNSTAHDQHNDRVILTTIRLGQHTLACRNCFLILPCWSKLCVRFYPCCLKGPIDTVQTQKRSVDRGIEASNDMDLY